MIYPRLDEVLRRQTLPGRAGSEAQVRRLVEAINERIRAANRESISGPSLTLRPFDVEQVVGRWRERRGRNGPAAGPRR